MLLLCVFVLLLLPAAIVSDSDCDEEIDDEPSIFTNEDTIWSETVYCVDGVYEETMRRLLQKTSNQVYMTPLPSPCTLTALRTVRPLRESPTQVNNTTPATVVNDSDSDEENVPPPMIVDAMCQLLWMLAERSSII